MANAAKTKQPLHTDLVGEIVEKDDEFFFPNASNERIGFVRAVYLVYDTDGGADVWCLVANLRGEFKTYLAIDLKKYHRRI